MNKTKIAALLLASLLCAASLVSCDNTDNAPDNTPENGAEATNTGDENGESGDVAADAAGLSAYNWKYADDEPFLKVGDDIVNFDEYRYYFMSTRMAYDGGDESYWNEETEAQLRQTVTENISVRHAAKALCEELGIEITDADLQVMRDQIDASVGYYGGEEVFAEILDSNYLTSELFDKLSVYDIYVQKLYEYFGDDESVLEYAKQNYVRVSHVLVNATDESGVLLEGDALAEKKAIADEVYEKAVAGEDFDGLVADYGEDPGMVNNTVGYYFTYGQMVSEFEEASFALEVGEISEPVLTSYGYHIIKKLPMEDSYILDKNGEVYGAIQDAMCGETVYEAVMSVSDGLTTENTEASENVTLDSIASHK